MPKLVKEITEGVGFSYSSEQGQVAVAQPRVFRVILNSPSELIDIQQECGVKIGDELRPGADIFCVSFDARYEGSSRLVLLCTFQFRNTADAASSAGAGQDPKSQQPDIRPANWTTSTSLVESPKSVWSPRTGYLQWAAEEPAVNPAGDMYEGVTALEPVVTIGITQFEKSDPTKHLLFAGYVNTETIYLGSLSMTPGTVMFRGVSYQPAIESWGGLTYRGWNAVYEFAYRRNTTKVQFLGNFGNFPADVDIGWDIAVPVTGFNCRAFAPNAALGDEDVYGQPLQFDDDGALADPPALPQRITAGDRVRAMIRVPHNTIASQAPSASPVALKLNGRPLKTHDANGNLINKPLVFAYRVQPATNLTSLLGLRLF